MTYLTTLTKTLREQLDETDTIFALGDDILYVKRDETSFRLEPHPKHGDDEYPDVAITYGISGDEADVILSSPSPDTVAVFTSGALSFAHSFDQTLKDHADRLAQREADAAE